MLEYLETTIGKFIFKVATDRLYSPEGVWVQEMGGQARLGITDYQQQLGGDIAFVHLRPPGTKLLSGDDFAEVETIKATISFQSPAAGEVVEVNQELDRTPETVNQEPYGKGWLAVIQPADWPSARTTLLDAAAYLALMQTQAQKELGNS